MLTQREIEELIDHARQNEQIQQRLDEVEVFLLSHRALDEQLENLPGLVEELYNLEAVRLILLEDEERMTGARAGGALAELPEKVLLRPRKEIRILMGDLERPFLSNRVTKELVDGFFPGAFELGSLALAPLWAQGGMLGVLGMGAASTARYHPGLDTHFLTRLARKVAAGIDAALLFEKSRFMERRQAAMEMAGAACHELAQPFTTILLQVERLTYSAPEGSPLATQLKALSQEVDRAGELIKRISKVSEYVTCPYAEGMRIIDVAKASAGSDPGPDQEQGE